MVELSRSGGHIRHLASGNLTGRVEILFRPLPSYEDRNYHLTGMVEVVTNCGSRDGNTEGNFVLTYPSILSSRRDVLIYCISSALTFHNHID